MNRENIEKLAAHLDQIDERTFFMDNWIGRTLLDDERVRGGIYLFDELPTPDKVLPPTEHSCGTAACVAGHAVILLGTDEQRRTCGADVGAIKYVAAGLLGLDQPQAYALFYGPWGTAREAAGALRELAAGA